jgi:hypothetical protein
MKKIVRTFLAIALATTILTHNLLAMNKTQQRQQPTTEKKQQLNQQINNGEAALKKAVDAKDNATTPQEKKIAHQNAVKEAKKLLENMQQRSLYEDVWSGYEQKKQIIAKAKLQRLLEIEPILKERIKQLNEKLEPITITKKGLFWDSSSAKPGKEKEYEILNNELKKENKRLAKVERAIRNYSVITGEQYANTYRLLLAGQLIGAWHYGPMVLYNMLTIAKQKAAFALTLYGGAKGMYNSVFNDSDATEEDKAKAEENLEVAKILFEDAQKKLKAAQENFNKTKPAQTSTKSAPAKPTPAPAKK